jgi:hypothetical protein
LIVAETVFVDPPPSAATAKMANDAILNGLELIAVLVLNKTSKGEVLLLRDKVQGSTPDMEIVFVELPPVEMPITAFLQPGTMITSSPDSPGLVPVDQGTIPTNMGALTPPAENSTVILALVTL